MINMGCNMVYAVVKDRLPLIWKSQAEFYNDIYTIEDRYTKKKPVYHDDYIEPHHYESVNYIRLKDRNGKLYEMPLSYFNTIFEICA